LFVFNLIMSCVIFCCCKWERRSRSQRHTNSVINAVPSNGNEERQPLMQVVIHDQPRIDDAAVRQRLSDLSNSHGGTQPRPLDKHTVDDFLRKSLSISDKHVTCSICLGDILQNELMMELECKHSFHSDCIRLWLTKYHSTCPMCRRPVNLN
jgi:hypothetical protein